MGIGPAGNVSGGKHPRSTGLQVLIHYYPAICGEPRLLCQSHIGPDSNAGDHEIRRKTLSTFQRHHSIGNAPGLLPEMKGDTMLLVQASNEAAELSAHHPFEWNRFRAGNVYVKVSRAE
jgi:hypothetical protein